MSATTSSSAASSNTGKDVAGGAAGGAASGSVFGPVGAVVGGVLGAVGGLLAASDQAGLDEEKAQVAQEQAAEIEAREIANENLKNQTAYRAKLSFAAAYAGSGKAGTGIGSQLEIQRQTDQANMISNEEAQFQQYMLKQQAGVDTTLASETTTSGYISAGGSILGGVTSAARMSYSGGNNPGYGGTQQAPGLNQILAMSPNISPGG